MGRLGFQVHQVRRGDGGQVRGCAHRAFRGNQEYFKEAYGREATLIPNGITPEADLPAKEISERWGLTQGSYVLYLGRIVPEKRPELLLEAYKQVKTDKRLVIAGDSSDTDDYAVALKEAAASDPRALFTGHVEGNLLSELYSNAYCYALPSDVEGLPMSLLEAMSHGAACVPRIFPSARMFCRVAGSRSHTETRGRCATCLKA